MLANSEVLVQTPQNATSDLGLPTSHERTLYLYGLIVLNIIISGMRCISDPGRDSGWLSGSGSRGCSVSLILICILYQKKTCLKRSLKNRQNNEFNDKW